MCRLSIKWALSTPLTDSDQAILQAACLSISLAGNTPMLPHALHSSRRARSKEAATEYQHCIRHRHDGARSLPWHYRH
jgi:hypothetical protein